MPPAKHLLSRDDIYREGLKRLVPHFATLQEGYNEDHPTWDIQEIDGETVDLPIVRASQIGNCWRQQGYRILQVEGEPNDPESLMKMWDGKYHENIVAHWLELMGHKVTDRNRVYKKYFKYKGKRVVLFRGEIDGIVHDIPPLPDWMERTNGKPYSSIWENKGLSTWVLRKEQKGGVSEIVSPSYRAQAMAYMHLSGFRSTLFTIKDKDNSKIRPVEWFYSPAQAQQMVKRVIQIALSAKKGKVLPREHDKNSWQCRYCEFSKRCWKS